MQFKLWHRIKIKNKELHKSSSRKWRCRFCREKTQDTKHYILECKKAQQILGGKITKEEMWRVITTLEGEDNDLKEVAGSLQRLYKEINR